VAQRYLVPLMALLLAGCGAAPSQPVENRSPLAAFSAAPLQGPAPLAVAFDASASVDPDGVIAAYGWALGDGATTASGVTIAHTYPDPGVFTVRLTVTDNRGATASAQRVISVTTADGNLPPIASFTVTPAEGTAPLAVSFDATASRDADGLVVGYAWAFGDGNTGSGSTVQHTYTTAGTYLARLTVTDDRGATASTEVGVSVLPAEVAGADRLQALGGAFTMMETVAAEPRALIGAVIDAALEATRLRGATALVGTLTETTPKVFAYTGSPADLLRVQLLDGRSFDIVFNAVPEGDVSGDGDRFFRNPHAIDFALTSNAVAGSLDMALASTPGANPRTQAGRLAGSFRDAAGHLWTIDTAYETYERSEVGIGNELESVLLTQGTASAPSLDLSIDVSRYHRYVLVNTAENVDRRVDHTIRWNGATYRLQGRVFVGFLNARPVDRDQWVITGSLTENDAVIGQFQASEDALGLSIWLQVGPDRYDLYFFSYL
jgi:PKD repeat protein